MSRIGFCLAIVASLAAAMLLMLFVRIVTFLGGLG